MCKQLHLKQKLWPFVPKKESKLREGIFTLVGQKMANRQILRWSGRQIYGICSVKAAETSKFKKLTDLLIVDECLARKICYNWS